MKRGKDRVKIYVFTYSWNRVGIFKSLWGLWNIGASYNILFYFYHILLQSDCCVSSNISPTLTPEFRTEKNGKTLFLVIYEYNKAYDNFLFVTRPALDFGFT